MRSEEAVSVVIPVRNREHLIARTLDSVLAQKYDNIRLYVVDNGSTDTTCAAVEQWGESNRKKMERKGMTLTLLAEPKRGASAARNRGLREVDTRMMLFFDSDDEMHPHLISEAMKHSSGVDIVMWKVGVRRIDGKRIRKRLYKKNLMFRHSYNGTLATQSYMVRTEFVRAVGGWNETAMVWNDWELGFRLLMAGPRIAFVNKRLVTVHLQKESITGVRYGDKAGHWEHTLSEVEQELCNSELAEADLLKMRGMIDYRRIIVAAHYHREGLHEEGEALRKRALAASVQSSRRKMLLNLIYRYTAHGGRGAYYMWNKKLPDCGKISIFAK